MIVNVDVARLLDSRGLPGGETLRAICEFAGRCFRRRVVEAWARAHTLPSLCAEFRRRPRWVPAGLRRGDAELLAEAAGVLGVRLHPSEVESLLEDVLQEMFLGLTGIRTWPTVSRAAERMRDRGLIPPKGDGVPQQPRPVMPRIPVDVNPSSLSQAGVRILAHALDTAGGDGGAVLGAWLALRGEGELREMLCREDGYAAEVGAALRARSACPCATSSARAPRCCRR